VNDIERPSNDIERPESLAPERPRNFLRRRWVVLIVLAALFIGVILLIRNLQHQQPGPQGAGPGRGGQNGPVAVSVATVTTGDIQVRVPALGTITPLASVTVRTQISGTLQKIAFTEGQLVHQGDFLAQIDPRPYEAALLQMKGNLRRDRALLADAKLDVKRYEGLVKEDSIAVQTLDTQRALVDQYEGTVESDEAQIKTAELNLQYTHIVSPITGRVGLRQVDQGNYVTPGDANGIVVINQLQPISALFSIPEDEVTAVVRRLQQGATLTVEAYDRADSAKLAEGKLLTLDNAIDTTTGTIKMRALFPNTDGLLYPNQFVNIQLLENLLQNQIIMPNAASHRGAPKGVLTDFVYVVNPDRTVSVRPVTLGAVDGERVAVNSGLRAGEIVVTDGADRLRDGAAVELPGAPGAPSRTAAPRSQGGSRRPADGRPAGGRPAAAQGHDAHAASSP
jgi:multidrug efflux system membrane fusion protein